MANSISIGVAYTDQAIVGGTVDNTPVGATTPSTGSFTTVSASTGLRVPVAAVTAVGSTQANAASMAEGLSVVSAGDGTKGARLPTAVAGAMCIVKTTGAGTTKIYPATGGTINALSADAAITMAIATSAIFIASSATQWYTIPLLPS